jgi:lipoprotein signal peptidase
MTSVGRTQQAAAVAAVSAAVILVDQLAKAWAWRHLVATRINPGGDGLLGAQVGNWLASPLPGAAFDVVDVTLLLAAFAMLLRRPRPGSVLLTGCAMLAGWSSNLLDRVGLHFLTAPGGERGAVDFLHLGAHYYNLADLVIIATTPLFVLTLGWQLILRVAPRPSLDRGGFTPGQLANQPRSELVSARSGAFR